MAIEKQDIHTFRMAYRIAAAIPGRFELKAEVAVAGIGRIDANIIVIGIGDVTPLRCVSYLLKLDETERRHVGTDGNVFGVAVL